MSAHCTTENHPFQQMRIMRGWLASSLLCLASAAGANQEVITVIGTQTTFQHANVPTGTVNLIRLAPGGAVNRNGILTSIPQYRGQHTYRIKTQLDGRQPHTAGPSWMDSPLHYMPSALVETLEVHRGIAPVRAGSALGGYINAKSYAGAYAFSGEYEFHGRITADNFSFNGSNSASALMGVANDRMRLFGYAVHEEGDEIQGADQEIGSSQYERDFLGMGIGRRWSKGEATFSYSRNNTGDAGTPVLPMDAEFYHTDMFNARGQWNLGTWDVEAQVHYQHTDHEMTNYHLRPAPDATPTTCETAPNTPGCILPPFRGTDRRHVRVDGESTGAKIHAIRQYAGGTLRMGLDMRQSDHDARITDPDVGLFFVENFNNATVDEYGVFAEWSGALHETWDADFGVRIQHTRTDSDPVAHFRPTCTLLRRVNPTHGKYGTQNGGGTLHQNYGPSQGYDNYCDNPNLQTSDWMPGPAMALGRLSSRFNAADLSQNDTEIDAVAVFRHDWSREITLEFGVAHKTRAPAYMERYLWVPLEVNAGLGDGNNNVGSLDLKPEKSWQLELGLQWQGRGLMFSPRVFMHRTDDYITGIPTDDADVKTVSGKLNGDATPVKLANVDAEFYGADMVFSMPVGEAWQLDGTVSYVRGKLRESFPSQDGTRIIEDDNVYRIPPMRGLFTLSRQLNNWVVSTEIDWVARQSKISQLLLDDPANPANHNRATSGYALYNLRAHYQNPGKRFENARRRGKFDESRVYGCDE